jgi:hypothetical protein
VLKCTYRVNQIGVMKQSFIVSTLTDYLFSLLSFYLLCFNTGNVNSYFFPVLVALVSYISRWITDVTCSAKVCRATSELLSHIYIVVFLFLCIIAMTKAQQIKALCTRIYNTLHIMMNADSPTGSSDSNKRSNAGNKSKND